MRKNTRHPASVALSVAQSVSHSPRHRKGAVLHIAVGIIAAAAVAWMGIASVTSSTTGAGTTGAGGAGTTAKRLKFRSPSTPIEIEAALGELGLTPKTLCAAGFNAQQTAAFTSAAATYARANIATYRAAMDDAGTARGNVARLTHQIQGGAGSAEDLTALAAAQSALTTALAQKQAFLNAAFSEGASAVNGGGGHVITLLDTVRANSRAWDIPASYLGDNRSERDWVNLRDALANDRIAAKLNLEPNPTCHELLLTAQATTNAANAFANLQNLPDIAAAWSNAFNQ